MALDEEETKPPGLQRVGVQKQTTGSHPPTHCIIFESLRYLVHLAEEQLLGIGQVPWVSSERPPLQTTAHLFPGGFSGASRGEQLLPVSAGQQEESVDVEHCCDTELTLFCPHRLGPVRSSELTTSSPNTFHLIVS